MESSFDKIGLATTEVAAGFRSPADDYLEQNLDLNHLLIKRPAATFFVRMYGEAMAGAGIHNKDILVVDRSVEPNHGKVVIAVIDGEFMVRRIQEQGRRLFLVAESKGYDPVEVTSDRDFSIWGVVTSVIHKV